MSEDDERLWVREYYRRTNDTVKKFYERHNINPLAIIHSIDTSFTSIRRYNPIVERYGLYKKCIKKEISVGDILGYDYEWREVIPDLFLSISDYFDENEDEYKSRSCKQLMMSKIEMLSSDSFFSAPMELEDLDPSIGAYFITNNGIHRYYALKILYLNDLYKNKEREQELKEEYLIPVYVREIDELKTYCNYIISSTMDCRLYLDVDDDYKLTGKTKLVTVNQTFLLDEDELLFIARQQAEKFPEFIEKSMSILPFKKFVEDVLMKEKENGKKI